VQAVIWTNVFQALMFLLAGAVTLAYLISDVSGGLGTVVATAGAAGRLNVIEWGPSITSPNFWSSALTKPNIVWVALLNGLFGSMAAFGTGPELMEPLVTVGARGESQGTLALTPIGTFVTLLIYLGLGAGLFTYYTQHPTPALARPDEILPHFVCTVMPPRPP